MLNELMLHVAAWILGLAALWALIELARDQRCRWTLWLLIPTVVLALGALPSSMQSLKGTPTQRRPTGEWVVISHVSVKNKAIYLWIAERGKDYPTSVQLPWSEQLEKQLKEGRQGAQRSGRPLMGSFSQSREDGIEALKLWEFDVESTLPPKD